MNTNDLDPRKHTNKILNREVFYKGKNIIQQGEEALRAYYIEEGRVEVLVRDATGMHEVKIGELGAGEIFGEMALINDEPRNATVRALEDCTLSVISHADMEKKIAQIPDPAMRALIHLLTKRLKKSTTDQVKQHSKMADLQDRMAGIMQSATFGINNEKRDAFREEVEPLLDKIQILLDNYRS